MGSLSAADRNRLVAILGMLGSNAPGERDNAARMAEQIRLQHDLTWAELLAMSPAIADEPAKPSAAAAAAAWSGARKTARAAAEADAPKSPPPKPQPPKSKAPRNASEQYRDYDLPLPYRITWLRLAAMFLVLWIYFPWFLGREIVTCIRFILRYGWTDFFRDEMAMIIYAVILASGLVLLFFYFGHPFFKTVDKLVAPHQRSVAQAGSRIARAFSASAIGGAVAVPFAHVKQLETIAVVKRDLGTAWR